MDFQFRNVYNERVVRKLAKDIKKNYPGFKERKFVQSIVPHLEKYSYGDRLKCITTGLETYLPKDFEKAATILIKSQGPELKVYGISVWDNFIVLPQTYYISKHGLNHYDLSMKALYEMTKRLSSEADMRPFIEKYPEKTLKLLNKWAKDKNIHVRRLVSECTRPRLPLGSRLKMFQKDPRPVLKLLEQLKEDPSLYVRRSVANNLNDIAKDNPDIVISVLKKWKKIENKETQWLVAHAARTLIKQGHPEALELLGYQYKPNITITKFAIHNNKIQQGESISFSFLIKNKEKKPINLMVDYVIDFKKANGRHAPKVFKIAKKKIKPNETIHFSKQHSFKKISTRVFYPGIHHVMLQVNGIHTKKVSFNLK